LRFRVRTNLQIVCLVNSFGVSGVGPGNSCVSLFWAGLASGLAVGIFITWTHTPPGYERRKDHLVELAGDSEEGVRCCRMTAFRE